MWSENQQNNQDLAILNSVTSELYRAVRSCRRALRHDRTAGGKLLFRCQGQRYDMMSGKLTAIKVFDRSECKSSDLEAD
ncbi:MAG: hypothetical protein JGK17_21785 [Microcoleus sp. PH2017_10_PVI_O_A]|uniref:hypothetical protein n=1 Tax=unclassified Microcoleus TaxID=2642155 RepID=UPI001DBD6FC3|nr:MULTISPECIES: hypothetical protein [unclassified Microcoleus]MCC3408168.1 hypothetical protein [Microcoleus sp. PH2017_10_PVI_O_A]MCC3462858.1 hypothetical protein [Microcoleus sp. PH2017_11_PCY_U_A]MCC3480712.1 hypothetical protein [Microcoleus sp. PH2017_12_PCY_D_A]MCC3530638.1 hypothetical protein [Microcoleus sp. PH2017_21_RUC_O_A]MCC3561107.1 hypothetical protein [Microcoleus sp. PH2017_27_LUM_O_A]